jgi:hypothetical protein
MECKINSLLFKQQFEINSIAPVQFSGTMSIVRNSKIGTYLIYLYAGPRSTDVCVCVWGGGVVELDHIMYT